MEGELGCGRMKQFGSAGTSAGAVATYWDQYWSNKYKCKLVSYQTPYSALVQDDSVKYFISSNVSICLVSKYVGRLFVAFSVPKI